MYDVYSVYNVTPIMNIQGNLETGKELLWKKYGLNCKVKRTDRQKMAKPKTLK